MKNLLLFFTLLLSNIVFSQTIVLQFPKKEDSPVHAINSDRLYSAIINTNLDKSELIPRTKSLFLEEELADSADLETVVYDENLSQYKLRFGFKQGLYLAKGLMNAKYVGTPIILYFDAIFSFNSIGQIQITFTNFSSTSFVFVNEENTINIARKELSKEGLEADAVITNQGQTILITQTAIGKALIAANGGLDLLEKSNRTDYRKSISEQFKNLEQSCKIGSGKWVDIENLGNYNMKMNPYFDAQVSKFETDNLVLSVDNYRWNEFIEYNLNYLFSEIALLTDGKIDKIALNGNVKYENVKNKVLPTDKKEQKKWLKQGVEL